MSQDQENLLVFWDYASTHANSTSATVSNYALISNIRSSLHELGFVKSFRAYGNFTQPTSSTRSPSAYSEFTTSGVTLLDFPEIGQKDAGAKMMLIDIVVHAWDHPSGNTIVIISNDRDVGYAVAVLRMRKYRVVVVCSCTAHSDLTAHASDKLDWTRVALGFPTDATQSQFFQEAKPSSSSSHLPSSSLQHQSKPNGNVFSGFQMPKTPSVTERVVNPPPDGYRPYRPDPLANMPPHGRARSHSVFSFYDPYKLDSLGDLSHGTPKETATVSALGDGPLFPHPKPLSEERARAESVPPHMSYTASNLKSVFQPFSEENSPPAWKGKGRDNSVFESDELNRQSAANIYSSSIFEPYGDATNPFQGATMQPVSYQEHKTQDARSQSSSSSSSRSSRFSMIDHPETTAPTSATTAMPDKDVTSIEEQITQMMDDDAFFEQPATEKLISQANSKVSSRRNSTGTNTTVRNIKAEKATSPISSPYMAVSLPTAASSVSPKVVVSMPQPVQLGPAPLTIVPAAKPQPKRVSVPAPVASTSAPAPMPTASSSAITGRAMQFQLLIDVLRKERQRKPKGTTSLTKSHLGSILPKLNPAVYKIAGIRKFGAYISLAVEAGVVRETISGEIALMPEYY